MWVVVGAVLVVAGIAALVTRRDLSGGYTSLLVAAAVTPVAAWWLAVTAISDDVLLTRYTAVATPFMLIAVAGAIRGLPRTASGVVAGVALTCAIAGSVLSHSSPAFYPDVRVAYEQLAAGWRPGDAIVVSGYASIGPITEYYRRRVLPSAPAALGPGQPAETQAAIRQRRRLWLIGDGPTAKPVIDRQLARFGYRSVRASSLDGNADLEVVLAVPET